MQRSFCDICGDPATDKPVPSFEVAIGEKFETTMAGSTAFRTAQCAVVATISFSFKDHRTGFKGPPDLCAGCRHTLAKGQALTFRDAIETSQPSHSSVQPN